MNTGQKLITALLTANALLLAALLWVQVAERPIFARTAIAQTRQLPNSGAQRQQMISLLAEVNRSMDETKRLLESGKVKVVVVPDSAAKRTPPTRR